ncbi:uncharacterized protein VDAG_01102 [Verticillium dahliae VdLs.17]|uniref:Uncharacterized protein n=2 Tax=Verticillium dahliae TaxID=27337 RepID=G2WTH9_VERDV|nr:uncharacterized protein VDAG_01102 [Verticillium dahliae VdLs.17]EGY17420.1 hypothetical protein VDAG_01102 [Verticillium dahliae VdLs.17]
METVNDAHTLHSCTAYIGHQSLIDDEAPATLDASPTTKGKPFAIYYPNSPLHYHDFTGHDGTTHWKRITWRGETFLLSQGAGVLVHGFLTKFILGDDIWSAMDVGMVLSALRIEGSTLVTKTPLEQMNEDFLQRFTEAATAKVKKNSSHRQVFATVAALLTSSQEDWAEMFTMQDDYLAEFVETISDERLEDLTNIRRERWGFSINSVMALSRKSKIEYFS